MASKKFAGGLAAASVALLAGCASELSNSNSRTAAATPPPAVAPSGALETRAMAFESFMRKGQGIDAGFSNAGDVRQALQAGAAHDPKQLEAGMIAYAALAALQERAFVDGVRRRGGNHLASEISADPYAALRLPGGRDAASRASAALMRQGSGLAGAGERVKRAAYKVQHQRWSKAAVAAPARRLAEVKRISATGYRPAAGDTAQLSAALSQASGRSGGRASPVVARGVALAALTVLGEQGRGRGLLQERVSGSCLRIAKLNLYQCLAASGPQYEDIYCLGQHAMIEPGQCVADAVVEKPRMTRVSYRR